MPGRGDGHQLGVQRRDLDEPDRIFGAGLFRPELDLVAEPDRALGPVGRRRSLAALLGRVVLLVLPTRFPEGRFQPPLGSVVVVALSSPAVDFVAVG